ncbi:LysR substrate-binding domain-containing protein [Romboutsia sp.]|uniref:LysR substrate-binding domain-containing protein n=1 Tax=Romboutsia sp. TaxID=1965302 RepID=UPI003F34D5A1
MLEELKTFIAVVEYNNFTKAGEHLNLSQPTVSNHIKNLENYFEVTLINRSVKQKTIVITDSGYTLYKKAKEIINLFELTVMEVRNTSDSMKGSLKIGATFTIGEYILPKFLAIFSMKYPDIDVEIFIDNTLSVSSRLKDLTLDIGLIEGIAFSSNFTQKYFLQDKMVLTLPYKSYLNESNFSLKKLQNQKWIVREEGSGTREFTDMFLSNNEIIPKNIMVLASNHAIKEAIKNNLGISILSNLIVSENDKSNDLSVIELGPSYIRHFSYILPKNINSSKSTQVFLDEWLLYVSDNYVTVE